MLDTVGYLDVTTYRRTIGKLDAKRYQTYLILFDTKVTLIQLYSTYYWVC